MKKVNSLFIISLIVIATILGDLTNGIRAITGYGDFSMKSIFTSFIFVLVWGFAAFVFGYKNNKKYIVFSTLYFSILLAVSVVCFILSSSKFDFDMVSLFLLPAVTVIIPLNGLIEVFQQVPQQIVATISIFLLGVMNYFIFYVVNCRTSKK